MKPLIGLFVMTMICAQNLPATEDGTKRQFRADVLTEPKTKSTIIPLTNEDSDLKDDVKVAVELISDKHKNRAFVTFSNKSQRPLWVPTDGPKTYKPDYQANTLFLWFGYFDEVWGDLTFMIPTLQLVPPGEEYKFEIGLDLRLLRILAMQRMTLDLKARIATKAIATSPDVDRQPLEEYLMNSFVIHVIQTKNKCENNDCVSSADQNVPATDDCSIWQSQVDESVFYYGLNPIVEKLTAKEKIHTISCLLKLEGRRDASDMGGYTRMEYIGADLLPRASIEIAALFYIRYIYLQKWDHAKAIALIKKHHYYQYNTKSSARAAYRSYKKWFKKVKAIGIDEARKKGLDPMDDCPGVEWY